jgi:hypothetical protein
MYGTFNGIHLRKVTSRKITTTDRGTTLYSFRASGVLPELEAVLRLYAPGLLILGYETVDGTIVRYNANLQTGYQITIERKA